MGIEMKSLTTNILVLLQKILILQYLHISWIQVQFPFLTGETDYESVMMLLHNSGMPMYQYIILIFYMNKFQGTKDSWFYINSTIILEGEDKADYCLSWECLILNNTTPNLASVTLN